MSGSDHRDPARFRLYPSDLDAIVQRGRSVFEGLRGSHIFMTGATGFVGQWMLESLMWANERLDLGVRTLLLTRDPDAFRQKAPHLAGAEGVDILAGDIRTFKFPNAKFDRVLHLAAETNTQLHDPDPEMYFDVIVDGTRRVLDFTERSEARSFMLVSSGAVYGSQPATAPNLKEDDPYAPLPTRTSAAYGEAKRCAEMLAYARSERIGFDATVSRCFAFLGPYLPLDSGFAVGNFMRDALSTGEVIVRGDGTPRRTFMYAGDMATWLWSICLTGRARRPYNVGSDEIVTIAELARLVARTVGPSVSVRVLGDAGQVGVGTAYIPDISRARTELGLEWTANLETAVKRTIAWHRHEMDPGPTETNR